MKQYGFLELLMARPPSRLARFPDLPLEQALVELQAVKEALAQAAGAAVPPAVSETPTPVAPPSDETMAAGLAALATNVWRTKGKMIDPATGEPREENRRAYRHVEAALEAFAQLGVRLSDWHDEPFDAGLPVKVLSFQPTPELTRDTIVEVVRPAVFWHDRLLQVGEVIVGIPENPQNPAP